MTRFIFLFIKDTNVLLRAIEVQSADRFAIVIV